MGGYWFGPFVALESVLRRRVDEDGFLHGQWESRWFIYLGSEGCNYTKTCSESGDQDTPTYSVLVQPTASLGIGMSHLFQSMQLADQILVHLSIARFL